jgi:hypothetical protein
MYPRVTFNRRDIMLRLEPMREAQELAKKQWMAQQAQAAAPPDRPNTDDLLRHIREENQSRAKPFPVCARCRGVTHPDEGPHWLFRQLCDSCGLTRLEKLARRAVKARGRRRVLRALRRLAK